MAQQLVEWMVGLAQRTSRRNHQETKTTYQRKDRTQMSDWETLLRRAQIPKRYWAVKVSSSNEHRKTVREYTRFLLIELAKGRGLFLLGSSAHLLNSYMAVVARSAIRRKLLTHWITSTDLRDAILNRGRIRLDENWSVDDYAREVHVLCIADLGEEHRDNNWLAQFRNLIRTRSHYQKITVLASEISVDHMSKHYTAPFVNFVNDNFLIANIS